MQCNENECPTRKNWERMIFTTALVHNHKKCSKFHSLNDNLKFWAKQRLNWIYSLNFWPKIKIKLHVSWVIVISRNNISLPLFASSFGRFPFEWRAAKKLTNKNIKFIFGCGRIIELCVSVFAKGFRVWKLSVNNIWFTVYVFKSIILFIRFFACIFPALLQRSALILCFHVFFAISFGWHS